MVVKRSNMKPVGPASFINRELSWLAFNRRVLAEAQDASNPLLERVKFFTIVSSNLDEYFEVRVAGIKQQMESGVEEHGVDGLTPTETFRAIVPVVRQMVREQHDCWRQQLVPALTQAGIRFVEPEALSREDCDWLDHYYHEHVRPVLTPLAIDPSHPFPQVYNKSLNFMVEVSLPKADHQPPRLAIVQVPRVLPRLIRLPRSGKAQDYVRLGKLVGHSLGDLFPGMIIQGVWLFRVTRNSELYLDESDTDNLLTAVEEELHRRRRGAAVRLEVEPGCPETIRAHLLENLALQENDLYEVDGPLNPGRLMAIYDGNPTPELRDPPFLSRIPPAFKEADDVFAAIRKRDLLLHHPYDSFEAVTAFLEQAAEDPKVLAIKQTLYRTGGDARILGALMKAAHHGKQVTAVMELKARFDEANNIEWARRLEEAGVHVVYGLVGYKIHAKITLVVRHDADGIRRYVHLSTGNYNPVTARLYTDLGLFTCHPDFGEDATNLFNLLTGICQFQEMRRFIVAPFELHARLLALIQREIEHARQGLPARIIAKMNSLVGQEIIEALYTASQAGVDINLIVRGICCLRPGLKGVSRNIRVRSIVDRFLEHSRVFYFENACQPEVFVSSADWMPRNFFRRIEVMFPILDGVVRERICREILALTQADNVKARGLDPDGRYHRLKPSRATPKIRSQFEFIKLAGELNAAASSSKVKRRYPQVKLAPRPKS